MAKALTAVLRSNLGKFGKASERIDNGDFVIQDTATKRDIDLAQDWEVCFLPGQRVSMSIIFDLPEPWSLGHAICPKCKCIYEGLVETEIEWYSNTQIQSECRD
jgi:hypothetical protein